MQAIIVDDEPNAINLLEGYLKNFPEIELVGSFRNGLKALSFLHKQSVDLIFLDINMPHISGLALARILEHQVHVVFTTAYAEHAVESYDLEAADYLLKPITLERFARCIRKLMRPEKELVSAVPYIMLKSGSKVYQLQPDQILYLEKDHNYMFYYLAEEKIMARQSTSEALAGLPEQFIQIHKSHIVNRNHIQFFDRHEVSVGGRTLSLGSSFRDTFLEKMDWKS